MTEEEWLACTDPAPMLELLRGKASDRKTRLFLVASSRRMLHGVPEPHSRRAVRTAERYADGEVSGEKLHFAWSSVRRSSRAEERLRRSGGQQVASRRDFALWLANRAVTEDPVQLIWQHRPVYWWLPMAQQFGLADELETGEPDLLRDIFGNPFRPVGINSAWLSPTVTNLATAAYEERAMPSGELDAVRLAVLADALEDAGCNNADILAHLRSGGPHVRGCWALDSLLEKG
jgi:hypothetical protein